MQHKSERGSCLKPGRQVNKYFDLWRRTRQTPSVQNVHRFRVATRRMRALVWAADVSGYPNDLNRRLKKVGQALGPIRDFDVESEWAKKLRFSKADNGRKRKKMVKNVKCDLRASRRRKLERELNKLLAQGRGDRLIRPDRVRRELGQLLNPWLKANPRTADDWHRLRIVIKKVRYGCDLIGKSPGSLRSLQHDLGLIHDLEILPAPQNLRGKVQARRMARERVVRKRLKSEIRRIVMKLISDKS